MIRTALTCAFMLFPVCATATCRHALALGLDVSGSVDATEYRQQLDGLAQALQSDRVRQVLFRQPDAPVRIAVYEWSGPSDQFLILPWTVLDTPAALASATAVLRSHQRPAATPSTAIGAAMLTGISLLESQTDCWRRTLDLSGDGPTNTGPRPQDILHDTLPAGIIINGLTVDSANPDQRGINSGQRDLASYYRAYVIRGPDAFVEQAAGFDDFATAMERKLLRELQSLVIGKDLQPQGPASIAPGRDQ